MDRKDMEKAYIAAHLLKVYPKSIRAEIIKDTDFCKEIGVVSDATITFGDSAASFSRAALMEGVRQAYASITGSAVVKCDKDNDWEVCIDSTPSIWTQIKGHGEEFNTDIFWGLNPDSDTRIQLFKEASNRYRFPKAEVDKWASILSVELSDNAAAELISDLRLTPAYLEQVLGHEVQAKGSNIETLVPDNLKYYERFIGVHSGSKNIIEYCENELVEHYRDRDFSYFDLLVCANFSISNTIPSRIIDEGLLKSFIEDAIKWQNPFMLIGCLEVGLAGKAGTFEEELSKAFDCLISPETYEQIKLISSLFVFIDGELSRLSVFKGKPSFYRRFAAFGQASLIAKVAIEHGIHFKEMEKWAMEQRGLVFFCQNFIDLRSEPRWLPEYSSAQQLLNELYGRLNGALNTCDSKAFAEKLQQILVKEKPLPLSSFFSGPLEGNVEPNAIPDDVKKTLEEKLGGEASLEAFTALINLTQVCKVDSKYAELAASLLENTHHQIEGDVTKEVIYQTLNGLATVAANLRSKKLAASVMILSRVYREYLDVNSSSENIFAIGLVSAAAFENKDEWAEYIGQWAYEIACLELNDGVRGSLFSMVSQLCVLEPYLYYTCSRSLEVLNFSF